MKYVVACYNGDPLLGLKVPFVRLDEVRVEVDADNESSAISKAKSRVGRDYYEIVRVSEI